MAKKFRTQRTHINDVPGKLPKASVSNHVDLPSLADTIVAQLNNLSQEDLTDDAVWRDFLSLTGSLRTIYSSSTVFSTIQKCAKTRRAHDFKVIKDDWRVTKFPPDVAWVDIGFTFSIKGPIDGQGAGFASVIPDPNKEGSWKIWMLRTWLENFDNLGHPDKLEPEKSQANGVVNGTTDHGKRPDYAAIIVGAGQAGLNCAGRLKALGIPYLIVESNSEIGENWTKRYTSLRWHTSRDFGHLPFDRTFEPEEDKQLPIKSIGAGFKKWSEKFGINVQLKTTVTSTSWDDAKKIWTINITGPNGDETLTTKNLVLATGIWANVPVVPKWPGKDKFRGIAIHSVDYRDSTAFKGKKGIVVGTGNTAHDVAMDMAEAGLDAITIVQRSKAFVFPVEWLHAAEDLHYNQDLPTTEADKQTATFPYKITREFTNKRVWDMVAAEKDRLDKIEQAGFALDRYGDILTNLYDRAGAHWVDDGTCDLIIKGDIKMKSNSPVKEWTEKGLKFEDGTEVEAGFVVLCTGFEHDFRKVTAQVVGDEIAEQVDDYFGFDPEGEIRGAYKPAGHSNLYYFGGELRQCRWFSRFIALQIQADALGKHIEPYGEPAKENSLFDISLTRPWESRVGLAGVVLASALLLAGLNRARLR